MAEINEDQIVDQEVNENLSAEDQFLLQQESLEEAEARSKEESSSGLKVNRLKVDKDGVYPLRFAPLAPSKDEEHKRGGYEYPAHNHFMKIKNPKADAKAKPFGVSVTRATECGFPVDVIDVYRKVAVDQANAKKDTALAEKIGASGFNSGLRFDYNHYAYVLDVDNRKDGWQLFQLSHSQFKELDEAKLSMWKKLCKSEPKHPCPISAFKDAFVVEVTRKTENKKTSYSFNIDSISPKEAITPKELESLLAAPRIYEVQFRYSRFHHEAVQVYLQQCDETYGVQAFDTPEVQDAIKQINDLLPATDTSSFSFDKKGAGSEGGAGKVTLDSLYAEFDALEAKGLGDKTEEGQELRQKIRDFMKDNKLEDVISIGRSTTNIMILDALDQAVEGDAPFDEEDTTKDAPETQNDPEPDPEPEPEVKEDQAPAPRERRARADRPARR